MRPPIDLSKLPEYATIPEASEKLFGSRGSRILRRAVDEGELRAYKLGERLYVKWTEVRAWVDSQRVVPKTEAAREHARRRVEEILARERAKEAKRRLQE